jgi:hypothetical protein
MKNTKLKRPQVRDTRHGDQPSRAGTVERIVDSFPFIARCFSRHRLGIGKR